MENYLVFALQSNEFGFENSQKIDAIKILIYFTLNSIFVAFQIVLKLRNTTHFLFAKSINHRNLFYCKFTLIYLYFCNCFKHYIIIYVNVLIMLFREISTVFYVTMRRESENHLGILSLVLISKYVLCEIIPQIKTVNICINFCIFACIIIWY